MCRDFYHEYLRTSPTGMERKGTRDVSHLTLVNGSWWFQNVPMFLFARPPSPIRRWAMKVKRGQARLASLGVLSGDSTSGKFLLVYLFWSSCSLPWLTCMMAFTSIAICTAEFFHPALGIEIALRSDDAWWVWSGDSPYDIHRNTQRNLEYIN